MFLNNPKIFLKYREFFGDKIYPDKFFFKTLKAAGNSVMFTLLKGIKGKQN
jgi:hypothetical protein